MFFIRETTSLREVRLQGHATCAYAPGSCFKKRRQTNQTVCVCPLQEGGVSGFLHSFIAEVFSMVRAHVAALGGNALVSYSMKECMLMENPNKNQVHTHTHIINTHCKYLPVTVHLYIKSTINSSWHHQSLQCSYGLIFLLMFFLQAQCLINVSGDAVICVRETDQEPVSSTTNVGQTCTSGTDGAT